MAFSLHSSSLQACPRAPAALTGPGQHSPNPTETVWPQNQRRPSDAWLANSSQVASHKPAGVAAAPYLAGLASDIVRWLTALRGAVLGGWARARMSARCCLACWQTHWSLWSHLVSLRELSLSVLLRALGRASAAGLRGDLLRLTHLWEILWGEAGQVPSGTREKSTTHCGLFQPKRLVPRSAGLRAQCRGRVELPGLLLR